MFLTLFILVGAFVIAVWAPFFYNLFLAGRRGPAFEVSADGLERSCDAALYVGKMRPTLPRVRLVATPDWVTAYAPRSRDAAYRRGYRGLADASMVGFRVPMSQIREMRPLGVGSGFKLTDLAGNAVYLYGRGVPATLGIPGA
jgi:hypothetical protein